MNSICPPLMDHFHFSNGELHVEDVPVSRIAAEVGTPVYIYSASTFRRHAQVFREGLSALPRVHLAYAIKANPTSPCCACWLMRGTAQMSSRSARCVVRWRRA